MAGNPGFDGPGSGGSGYVPAPISGQGWTVDPTADTITFYKPVINDVEIVVNEFTPGSRNGTSLFAIGSWCPEYGYPSNVEFFGDRLWFAGTPTDPQTAWSSQTGDYVNFGRTVPTVDTDAVTITINARKINAIVDLLPLESLIVLTIDGEWKLTEDTKGNVSPGVGFKPQSFTGSGSVEGIIAGDSALIVSEQGQRAYDLAYRFESDKFKPQEISTFADHLFEGYTFIRMDWAPAPGKVVWFVRADGKLVGCTYMPAMEVIGWHQHDTGGTATGDDIDEIIDIACVPGSVETMTHMLVKRVVNGVTRTYIEEFAEEFVDDDRDWFYVDCGLTFDGRDFGVTGTLTDGTTWAAGVAITLTADDIFDVDDVGDKYRLFGADGESVVVLVTAFIDTSNLTVVPETAVPASLQDVAADSFDYAPNRLEGFDHLEGREVAILADAVVQTRKTVVDGGFDLDEPAFVVQAGLPYRAHATTLELNIAGGEPIRDMTKLVGSAAMLVRKTRGLRVGSNMDYLETVRDEEFLEADQGSAEAITGLCKVDISSAWGINNGRIHIVSDDPLPAEILSVTPKFLAANI